MEPLLGFIIFGLCTIIVSVIAGKRMGAVWGVLYAVAICVIGFLLVVMTSRITEGNGLIAGWVAFSSPLLALIAALCSSTSERKAVLTGEYGEYKKCQFCAESVRKEAVKCKHCGSDLKGDSAVQSNH